MKKIKLFVLVLSVLVSAKSFAEADNNDAFNLKISLKGTDRIVSIFEGNKLLCGNIKESDIATYTVAKKINCDDNYNILASMGEDTMGLDAYKFEIHQKDDPTAVTTLYDRYGTPTPGNYQTPYDLWRQHTPASLDPGKS